VEKFWKLALQANGHSILVPTAPMEMIATKYPNMDISKVHKKPEILERLQECKRKL
jgi:hypothetical protein